MDLRITLDRPDRVFRPGEWVTGKAFIRSQRDVDCRKVVIRRYWKTHGKGDSDSGDVLERVVHEGRIGQDRLHEFPFRFPAPPGPYTYHGELINVDHFVEVLVDVEWSSDPKESQDFLLVPGPSAGRPHAALSRSKRLSQQRNVQRLALRLIGGVTLFIGVVSLPWPGFFLAPIGGAMLAAGFWRAVARAKLGTVHTRMSSRIISPGEPLDVRLAFEPQKHVTINGAEATLLCREVATSGTGSDRKTHRHNVYTAPTLMQGRTEARPGERTELRARIPVPDKPVYSFGGDSNKVEWLLRVNVDIPAWPDWREEHELIMWPGGGRGDEALEGTAADPVAWQDSPEAGAPALAGGAAAAEELARLFGAVLAPGGVEGHSAEPPTSPTPDASLPMEEEKRLPPEASEDIPPEASMVISEARTPASPSGAGTSPAPLPDPGEAHPDVEPAPGGPLDEALTDIAATDRWAPERKELTQSLIGRSFAFTLVVVRRERTFGGRDPRFRSGRTLVGTLEGTDLEAVVRYPESRNEEVDAIDRGDRVHVTGRVAEWQALYDRPLLDAS